MTLGKEKNDGYYSKAADSSASNCVKATVEIEKQFGHSTVGEICVLM